MSRATLLRRRAILAAATAVDPGEGDWGYYREITVDNTGGDAKTDWPVKVSLTAANFTFADAQTDGADLRFRATDGTTELDFWIESYDSVAETAVLWVQVPTVTAGGSATVRLYYGNALASSASDGGAVFTTFDDFDDMDSLRGDFYPSHALGNARQIISRDEPWKNTRLIETGNVIDDPTDADSSRRYKLYFSGQDSGGSPGDVGVAFSPDGVTWTEYGSNPIITAHEDPYVVRVDATTWHLWVEDGAVGGGDIAHFTSTDGITWTEDVANNPVITRGDDGFWTDTKVGSPCVTWDGTTFTMLYDGYNGDQTYQSIGVARSTDGVTWTHEATNPIFIATDTGWTPNNNDIVCSDIFLAADGVTWVMLFHDGDDQAGYAITTDAPADWDDTSFTNPLGTYYGRHNDVLRFGQTLVGDQDAGDYVWQLDVLSQTSPRIFERVSHPDGQFRTPITIESSILEFDQTAGGATYGSGLILDADVVADFALGARIRKNDLSDLNLYTRIGFGDPTDGLVAASSNNQWPSLESGYVFMVNDSSDGTSVIHEISAARAAATLGAGFNVAGTTSFAIYELRYEADGTLTAVKDGSTLATRTDSTFVASTKDVFVAQGYSTNRGARAEFDWVYVRKFDGVDPSAAVGSAVAA